MTLYWKWIDVSIFIHLKSCCILIHNTDLQVMRDFFVSDSPLPPCLGVQAVRVALNGWHWHKSWLTETAHGFNGLALANHSRVHCHKARLLCLQFQETLLSLWICYNQTGSMDPVLRKLRGGLRWHCCPSPKEQRVGVDVLDSHWRNITADWSKGSWGELLVVDHMVWRLLRRSVRPDEHQIRPIVSNFPGQSWE